jgi:hypothetical protein
MGLAAIMGRHAFWNRYNSGTRPAIDPPFFFISSLRRFPITLEIFRHTALTVFAREALP